MAEDRVDPYIEGLEHERVYENVYFADIRSMIRLLEEFARTHMSRWKKEYEEISPDGRAFTCHYTHSERMTWEVKARSWSSRIGDGLRAYQGGDIRAVAAIPYDLQCDFTLKADRPNRIQLSMRAQERIDPHNSVTDYPLGYHYYAPSYLYLEDYFGEKLDPFLTSRLIPR